MMKRKIALIWFMIGVLSASLTFSAVLGVLSPIGGFILGYSYLLFVKDDGDILCGIRLEGRIHRAVRLSVGALGMLFGGNCVWGAVYCVALLVSENGAVKGVLIILLFVMCSLAGWRLGRMTVMKSVSEKRIDEVLGEYPLFDELREKIPLSSCFIVSREWIALYDDYYCFAVFLYKEHELCDALTREQLGILCGHFARRYENEFYLKKAGWYCVFTRKKGKEDALRV